MKEVQTLSTGAILSGLRGSGKSQVLAGVAAWAHNEGNWVIVKIPRGTDFTKNATNFVWEPNGLYMHPEVGYDILREIYQLNKEKLHSIEVNQNRYGNYSISGFHKQYDAGYEPLPNQEIFLENEQVWTNDWKNFYPPELLNEMMGGVRQYNISRRYTRFEYDMKLYSAESVPEVFAKVFEEKLLYDDITLHDLFDADVHKTPSKKVKPPKCDASTLTQLTSPKKIHSQDLEIEEDDDDAPQHYARPMTELLPKPKTLGELAEFALKNPIYSINALYEIMDHFYRNDQYNVLVLVDEYNEFFSKTEYLSIKYANYKDSNSCIYPWDMSLGRLFMRFDGHMIKNGAKVVAVSEKNTNYTNVE